MNQLLIFLKGSSIHRAAFSHVSGTYPCIELSTNNIQLLKSDIQEIISNLKTPTHIIAFGDYSRNINYVRAELVAKNKFRNKIIGEFDFLQFNSYLALKNLNSKIQLKNSGIGNSYCNLFSYLFINELNKNPSIKKQIYFDFLHLSKKFQNINSITKILEVQIP